MLKWQTHIVTPWALVGAKHAYLAHLKIWLLLSFWCHTFLHFSCLQHLFWIGGPFSGQSMFKTLSVVYELRIYQCLFEEWRVERVTLILWPPPPSLSSDSGFGRKWSKQEILIHGHHYFLAPTGALGVTLSIRAAQVCLSTPQFSSFWDFRMTSGWL